MKNIYITKPKPSNQQRPMSDAKKKELKEKGYQRIMNELSEQGIINIAETVPVSSIKSGVSTDSVEDKPSCQVKSQCSEPNTHRGCLPLSLLCCRLFKKQPTQAKSHNETAMVKTLEMGI